MQRPFYGWVITAAAFVVLFLAYGVQYSFGVFVPAIVAETGWPRASLGGAFSLYSIVYTGFTLVSGKLTDAHGPRLIIGAGGVLLGVGIIATSYVTSLWQLFFWYGIVAALGMSTAYIPCNMTVVKWFHRKRGRALGFASSGASCGILLMPIVASLVITSIDWRTGLCLFGIAMLVITSIAARFMVRDPAAMNLQPDGDTSAAIAIDDTPAAVVASLSLSEARKTISFWMLLAGFALAMMTIGVPFVHLVSYAEDIGLSGLRGATSISVIGFCALCSGIVLGALSDKWSRKRAIVIAFACQVLAFALLIYADDPAALFVAAALFGIFYGGFASLYPALVGDQFGPAFAGTIGGFIVAGGGILGGWGPALTGYFRDVYGNYDIAFIFCCCAASCAVIVFLALPRPKPR